MSAAGDPRKTLVVALCGGVGGAKLALGLSRVVPDADLMVVANTGDDFEHLGLAISPDLDTIMYTLAGLADPQRGWGRRDETWTPRSAAKPGLRSATATSPPMWNERDGARRAKPCPRSPPISAVGSKLRRASCR